MLQILGLLCTPALLSRPYKNSFFPPSLQYLSCLTHSLSTNQLLCSGTGAFHLWGGVQSIPSLWCLGKAACPLHRMRSRQSLGVQEWVVLPLKCSWYKGRKVETEEHLGVCPPKVDQEPALNRIHCRDNPAFRSLGPRPLEATFQN